MNTPGETLTDAILFGFDRAEENLAEIMAGKAVMRLEAIREIENPVGRAAEFTQFAAIRRTTRLTQYVLGIRMPDDHMFHGATGHSTLIRNKSDGQVTRIHRASVGMDDEGRTELATTFYDQLKTVSEHMDEFVPTGQQVLIARHPFRPGVEGDRPKAVQITQPYFDWGHAAGHSLGATGLFESQRPGLRDNVLGALLRMERPGMQNALNYFAIQGLALIGEGLYLDVSRPQALLAPTAKKSPLIMLNSGLPMLNPKPHDKERQQKNLQELKEATDTH